MTLTTNPLQPDKSQSQPECGSPCLDPALRLPDTFELLTHLKLVFAIICLKNAVDEDGEMHGMKPGNAWDHFCLAAAVKFLKWSEKVNVSDKTIPTPPLDILMIWHSYMLNTRDYVQFEKEASGARMAGNGIDWPDLKRKLDFDFDGMGDVLAKWATSDKTHIPRPKDLTTPTHFDMVAAVQRQLKFADKVHNADWRRPEILETFLRSAIVRYTEFFTLIAENPGVGLAPTLAIDLVWHTHQLSPRRYRAYSRHMTNGRIVCHDDKINKTSLEEASQNAENLYFAKYGVPYKHTFHSIDQTRPMCFADLASVVGPGSNGGLVATPPTEPSSCSARCSNQCFSVDGSECGTRCRSSCTTRCSSGCKAYCRDQFQILDHQSKTMPKRS